MRAYLLTAYGQFCSHMYSRFLNTIYQQFISFISMNKDTGVVCCRAEIFAITYLPFHCIISFRIFIAGIYKKKKNSDKIHERLEREGEYLMIVYEADSFMSTYCHQCMTWFNK